MGKRILALSYWGLDDVLTQAAVLPHIELLQQVTVVSEVILVTIEREKTGGSGKSMLNGFSYVKHYTLQSSNYRNNLFNKVNDFLYFPGELRRIAMLEGADMLLASGAPAGALAYKVWQKTRIPFYVVFEPHAAYMRDSKVWHRYDPRYIFQRKWEEEQLKAASGLLVVSEEFRQLLLSKRTVLPVNILTARNLADLDLFGFSLPDREKIRHQLAIPSKAVTGIYVGKYGGLYYQQEAFAIYKKCFESIPDFRLIILSPQPQIEIINSLNQQQIDISKVYIASVPHQQVPLYLSAADFGFATIKSYPSARYCSPVKIGEYWANGLPVLLTEGVGDDSDIIRNEGGGALFNLQQEGSVEQALQQILSIISNPSHRREIPELAAKYRSPERIREAYEYFFGQRSGGGQV